jgi:beta-ureidopropionase
MKLELTCLCIPQQEHLPAEQLDAVKRVLYGANQGQPVAALELPKPVQVAAEQNSFDLQGYQFKAAAEQMRQPRIVRIGLIQHGIVQPTTAPFLEQRQVGQGGVPPAVA